MADKRKAVYGAPDPPDILFAKGVLHPHTLSDEITEVIFGILKARLAEGRTTSVAEMYKLLCEKGAMKFQREVYLARDHPIMKQIAGARQHLRFSGRLKGAESD